MRWIKIVENKVKGEFAMTITEMIIWIIVGTAVFVLLAVIITIITTKINSKKIENVQNIYLGKLSNSDLSIQDAMKYLKLTNGIRQGKSKEGNE